MNIESYGRSNFAKDRNALAMPKVSDFIEHMRFDFGVLTAIEAKENGQSVKWGESWGECVEFPLTSKDMK